MSYGDVKGNFNESKMEPEYLRKLFLGGLSFSTTEETLRDHFSKWGEIVDCVVMKHPNTTQSRGFGFVTYSHSSMVDECQQNRPHRIDNRNIEPKRAIPRDLIGEISSEANIRKLFIGGLRDDITENDLREYFSQFGNITDCLLAVERDTQKPRGFGFVEFDDYDPTDKIVLQKVHEIKGKKVNVKKAISKTEMQNKKSSNWQNDGGMGNGYGGNRAMGNGYGHGGPGGNQNYGQGGYGGGVGGGGGVGAGAGGWNNNAGGGGGGGAGGPPNWNNANAPIWNSGWNNGNQAAGGPGPMRGGYQNNRPAPYRKRN